MQKLLVIAAAAILIPAFVIFLLSLRSAGSDAMSGLSGVGPTLEAALTGEGKVRCEFLDAASGATSSAYVSSGKIRVDGPGDDPYHLIFFGPSAYVWFESNAQGYVYAGVDAANAASTTLHGLGIPLSRAALIELLSKSPCKEASLHPDTYQIPTSVDFRLVSPQATTSATTSTAEIQKGPRSADPSGMLH